ncbi:hypothetical protein SAMN04487819_108261 [Actinopolyspora alba]|uniref:Uncharacterized protein n=2 Tax=Actinopolyspora alba TaxID=673379 RepID=A0A1I1Y9P1_9ACTN|nr:hypothetical protein SAMN04487819_108261 [Actinopolyspora alba]
MFCLLHHKGKVTVNPLDLDQWTFFVVPTAKLNDAVGNQSKIGPGALRNHGAVETSHTELHRCFHQELIPPGH